MFSNVRDLGLLPRRDGGETLPGRVIRAGLEGQTAAADMLPRTEFDLVVDLRWPQEVAARPHPWCSSLSYRHLPWVDADAERLRDAEAERDLGQTYANSLRRNRRTIAMVFTALASADPSKSVLISCTGGRDRTGMAAALLLDLAAVERVAIEADYARTPGADPVAIRTMLARVDSEFGSTAAYLGWLGVAHDQVSLRARLAGEAGSPRQPDSRDGGHAGGAAAAG